MTYAVFHVARSLSFRFTIEIAILQMNFFLCSLGRQLQRFVLDKNMSFQTEPCSVKETNNKINKQIYGHSSSHSAQFHFIKSFSRIILGIQNEGSCPLRISYTRFHRISHFRESFPFKRALRSSGRLCSSRKLSACV